MHSLTAKLEWIRASAVLDDASMQHLEQLDYNYNCALAELAAELDRAERRVALELVDRYFRD